MPREENGPVPQQEESGSSGQPKLADVCRPSDESLSRQQIKLMMSCFEEQAKMLENCLGRLEYDARQPRFSMEADGPANTKARERTEGAVTAVQATHWDSCTAQKVQNGSKTSSSFGMKAKPPALPCRDDVLVEYGATAPKSCLPSLEMRSSSAAGGLLPAADTSTATRTTFNKSPFRLYATKEANSKKKKAWTSIPSACYDSSFWKLLAGPPCLRVIETNTN